MPELLKPTPACEASGRSAMFDAFDLSPSKTRGSMYLSSCADPVQSWEVEGEGELWYTNS